MKKILALLILLSLGHLGLAQEFDHGNNKKYTTYHSFVGPVLKPSPLNQPINLPIANKEKNVVKKFIKGANSGIHFPKGTPGVKTVRYDLYITDTTVNFSGKDRPAMAVNGVFPGPTLSFTLGDTALVYVHNLSSQPTSIHWHGVQLPSRMDGVAYLTQMPIPPQTVYVYKFPVVQAGTYWYHSHYMLQEQIGVYGALIFNKRTEPTIPTIPVVLSDWSDTNPQEIQRMLHTGNDWFGIKKHSTQSYWEALKAGKLGVKFVNEWKRMEAMDVSDVYYESFLVNGKLQQTFSQFKAGDRVRLRIIGGGSSSYFWLTYSGGKITVVANDGNDVVPVSVDRLIIGPSETYDVVVTIPKNMQYEFLATAEDRSGSASLWLGSGMKMPAKELPKLNYFAGMKMMNEMMKMNGDMKPMGAMALQEMDMNAVMYPELSASKHSHHKTSKEIAQYVCPMHSDVVSDHPGTCPKCGMKLVKKKASVATAQYVCPMHSDEVSDQPGTCPKCGMKLVKKEKKTHHHSTHNSHDGEIVTLNYNMLEALKNTELPKENTTRTLRFELTGNMNRYVWSMNNKTVGESDKILIHKGENLRIILYNNTMMRHPIHLHGHDFRLLNKFGKRSPMKNVVDIMPMETDTLEFYASESGNWFFHCHILYHMMGGMGRIFQYADSPQNPEIMHPKHAEMMLFMDERRFYLSAENDFASNGNTGGIDLETTRWGIRGDWQLGYNDTDGYEAGMQVGRYFGHKQWLFSYVGFEWQYKKGLDHEKSWFGQRYSKERRFVGKIGVQYTLPWLVVADASVDHTGHVVLAFEREDIPLSPRLRGSFMFNSDKEYQFGLQYIIFKNMAFTTNYSHHFGWGAGIQLSY